MSDNVKRPVLTQRYLDAFAFAAQAHGMTAESQQVRKKTEIPYLSHLMAVSALVWEYGGTEDHAIAALLHDALEDTATTAEELEAVFGAEVRSIVVGCTDGVPGQERSDKDWKSRKEDYVAHLGQASPAVALVSAADKLHNASAILADMHRFGPELVWGRFNASRDDSLWFYNGVVAALEGVVADPNSGAHEGHLAVVARLKRTVTELEAF